MANRQPVLVPDLYCQIRVSERAWKAPGIRERSFHQLRRKLELAGARDIKIEAPQHIYVDGFVDEKGDWHEIAEPYWAWDIIAIGQKDA